jgi:hypothetical protein
MKKTGDPDIKKAYRKHKHHLQKLTRQAYWRYIEGIITPDDLDREGVPRGVGGALSIVEHISEIFEKVHHI